MKEAERSEIRVKALRNTLSITIAKKEFPEEEESGSGSYYSDSESSRRREIPNKGPQERGTEIPTGPKDQGKNRL